MKIITIDRALLEQALEALEKTIVLHDPMRLAAVTALRAALAQEQAEPVQEPVAWMYTGIMSNGIEHGPHLIWKPKSMDAMSASRGVKATPLYTAPPQRNQAEPVQEPVAWECKAGGLKRLTQRQYDAQPDGIKRHYTRIAPPQRKQAELERLRKIEGTK